jgi:ABC-2 type transport system permease protein
MIGKIFLIALKDAGLAFRDRTALLLMFVAPIALTMVMGFAFGGSDEGPSLEHIPVVVVNHDSGQFSPFLTEALESDDLKDLLDPTYMESDEEARLAVDNGKAVAAILIPATFSDSVMPAALLDEDTGNDASVNLAQREKSTVIIYGDPASQTSVFVVRSVINTILMGFNSSIEAGELIIGNLLTQPGFSSEQFNAMGDADFLALLEPSMTAQPISLTQTEENPGSESTFNWLSYSASGLAILFLMFTMTSSARTLLSEKVDGTLARLMVSPTPTFAVISGKMLGVFIIGFAQMLVLLVAGRLLFNIQWGSPLDVLVFTIFLTAAAACWGIFIAAISKTPGQVSSTGAAVNLIFAAIGGSFVPRFQLPAWLKTASLFTPNALGIEGLTKLVEGGSLASITMPILGCVITIVVLLSIATYSFNRQYR